MKFYVIASSSKGNVSYLEVGNKKILIDAGISYLKIKHNLKKINVDIKEITDIFITHEHRDHINGLEVLLRYINPQLHMSEGTLSKLKIREDIDVNIISAFDEVVFENLIVTTLPLSHDAEEPLGYLFTNGTKKLAFITDTGYLEQSVKDKIKNATLYYFESNHDPYLLMNSKRPHFLVRRILQEKGHLSNYDSAYYFSQVLGEDTTHLIFAHVSQQCNTSELILKTYEDVLTAQGKDYSNITFIEAKEDEPLEVIKL